MNRCRRLFSLAGMLLLLPLLCACHGQLSADSFTMPETAALEKNIEITFWAKNDTNKTQTEIYNRAIREFEEYYPNIHVNLRLYTDYGKIYNDVITNIQTGTTPDVCVTYPDHIATYLTGAGTVVPLSGLMADPDWGLGGKNIRFDAPAADELIPQYTEECRINGELYAVPFMRSSEALYINKTMVEALGFEVPDVVTWDFIWQVSDAAAATRGADGVYAVNGQHVLIPFIYKSTDNMMIQYLRQMDAPYSDEEGNIYLFSDWTRDVLKEVARHVPNGAFSTFKISGYPANFLNAGQCIFAVDSTAGSTWMGSDAPLVDISPENLVRFETAVRCVPQVDAAHPAMISQGPSVCIFNKPDPERVIASWVFVQYLLSNEVQIPYAQTEGYVPVTSKAREDASYKEYLSLGGTDNREHYSVKIEATKLVIDHTADTFVTPVFNGSASLRDAAGSMVESTVKGIRRGQKVDDAWFERLYADTISLYHLEDRSGDAFRTDNTADPLPPMSAGLLFALAFAWGGIIVYLIIRARRKTRS